MKNQKGFSLIELLIVVVIIGIIAAIAIPNLLASRRSANEGSAVSALRTIHSAQMTYNSTYGGGNYAADLATLATNNLVDSTLGGGTKSGYVYTNTSVDKTSSAPATFVVSTMPTSPTGVTATGTRRFCVETDGVIKADSGTLGSQFDSAGCTAAAALNN